MKKNKKKIILLLILLIIILFLVAYAIIFVYPYSKYNVGSTHTLERFYQAFTEKDYGEISELMENGNPQPIITTRQLYGDIEDFKILYCYNHGQNRKKVRIQIRASRNDTQYKNYDTVLMIKKEGNWVVRSYHSNVEYVLP
ncbi:hypothetical protein DQG13_20115 [Paenibacillus sp. YN15]|nr:hypothetical protein DQG13_20115 [Paenibacillus sp. YN15]